MTPGARVMEVAQLNCGELLIHNGDTALRVRPGKGGRRRLVRFNHSFQTS